MIPAQAGERRKKMIDIFKLPSEPWQGFYPREDDNLAEDDGGNFYALSAAVAEFWQDLVTRWNQVEARKEAFLASATAEETRRFNRRIAAEASDPDLDVQVEQMEALLDDVEGE